MRSSLLALALPILAVSAAPTAMVNSSRPLALVYRGPAACSGCPESVGHLLATSKSHFRVQYVGPDEDEDITADSLSKAAVYAQPGGGGVSDNWPHLKKYNTIVRNYVREGGRYMGFCLGAYFAGTPGYNLLPQGSNTDEEISQPGAQVKNQANTVIQVNWNFTWGPQAGTTENKQWLFFQDGAVILLNGTAATANGAKVLGRYSANGDIAASVTPFGDGWVGVVGPHPEATKDWYEGNNTNPDGYGLTIGYDFAETVYTWEG